MKKRLSYVGLIILILGVILVFSSCEFFQEGILVKNATDWTISVCFSSDKINAEEGWTKIATGFMEKVTISDGIWYLGIKTTGVNVPSGVPEMSWSIDKIDTSDQSISSIEISYNSWLGYRYELKKD